jgi:hypothetical protein
VRAVPDKPADRTVVQVCGHSLKPARCADGMASDSLRDHARTMR